MLFFHQGGRYSASLSTAKIQHIPPEFHFFRHLISHLVFYKQTKNAYNFLIYKHFNTHFSPFKKLK